MSVDNDEEDNEGSLLHGTQPDHSYAQMGCIPVTKVPTSVQATDLNSLQEVGTNPEESEADTIKSSNGNVLLSEEICTGINFELPDNDEAMSYESSIEYDLPTTERKLDDDAMSVDSSGDETHFPWEDCPTKINLEENSSEEPLSIQSSNESDCTQNVKPTCLKAPDIVPETPWHARAMMNTLSNNLNDSKHYSDDDDVIYNDAPDNRRVPMNEVPIVIDSDDDDNYSPWKMQVVDNQNTTATSHQFTAETVSKSIMFARLTAKIEDVKFKAERNGPAANELNRCTFAPIDVDSSSIVPSQVVAPDLDRQAVELQQRARAIMETMNEQGRQLAEVQRELASVQRAQYQRAVDLRMKERQMKAARLAASVTKITPASKLDQALHDIRNISDMKCGKGHKARDAFCVEKRLAQERLGALLKSTQESCPKEDVLSVNPKALNWNVKLMAHQRHALEWMSWRETQFPRGGLLADDMGLGKTLTVLALILRCRDEEAKCSAADSRVRLALNPANEKENQLRGGTLVVCPASVMNQWAHEVKVHVQPDVLDVVVYHGPNREISAAKLAQKHLVVTSYSLVRAELPAGALHHVLWERIVLDEGHVIRNHKAQGTVAICELKAKCRWVLTGTPIHNRKKDMYALMKFLKLGPFDTLGTWTRWMETRNALLGHKRLQVVLGAIMLRRTKTQLMAKKELNCLPEKHFHEVEVKLTDAEMAVYGKVLEFSRNLFTQFLQQGVDKALVAQGNRPMMDIRNGYVNPFDKNTAMGKLAERYTKGSGKVEIKAHVILVLLLRLRQICCHPGLIDAMLNEEEAAAEDLPSEEVAEVDALALASAGGSVKKSSKLKGEEDEEDEEDVLVKSNPVFNLMNPSSKIQAVIDKLDETVLNTSDKVVIVSTWTSMLRIVRDHLKAKNIECESLTGDVPVNKRGDIIQRFNDEKSDRKVLLLSLTAGGVGLNLVGGNHLFLCDLHWNPQLEAQACDRVYRVGQKKPVHIHKFVCDSTIETRIKALQEKKLALATDILTGSHSSAANKLTVQDMKLLFEMV